MSNALKAARERQLAKTKKQRQEERDALQLEIDDVRGAGPSIVEAMANECSSEEVAKVIGRAMRATTTLKDGTIKQDHRTQLDAAKLSLAYSVGTPVQRQEQVNLNLDMNDLNPAELIDKLSESPAMRGKLREMLAEADNQADKKAIDV